MRKRERDCVSSPRRLAASREQQGGERQRGPTLPRSRWPPRRLEAVRAAPSRLDARRRPGPPRPAARRGPAAASPPLFFANVAPAPLPPFPPGLTHPVHRQGHVGPRQPQPLRVLLRVNFLDLAHQCILHLRGTRHPGGRGRRQEQRSSLPHGGPIGAGRGPSPPRVRAAGAAFLTAPPPQPGRQWAQKLVLFYYY